jgi:hypothetical protein
MQDRCHNHCNSYFHDSQNINVVPQCFNYAKCVFPMSVVVCNLNASALVRKLTAMRLTATASNLQALS